MPYFEVQSRLRNLWQYHYQRFTADDRHIIDKLKKTAESVYGVELDYNNHYFLRYEKGSFAIPHTDNPNTSYVTCVVPLEISDDIEGGETCVYTKNDGKLVLPIDVGEVLFYGYQQKHSVEKLIKGSRLVFISWFKRKEN